MTWQQQQKEGEIGTIHLDLPATLQFLSIIGVCLSDILLKVHGLEPQELVSYDIQLAVQELCTNIVRHAYDEQQDERIQVTITFYQRPMRLTIELQDHGKLFDETQVQEPDFEEGQIHGYGLFLIKSLMDEVIYTRNADGNNWYLLKNLALVHSSEEK